MNGALTYFHSSCFSKLRASLCLGQLAVGVCFAIVACRPQSSRPDLGPESKAALAATTELYTAVWKDPQFSDTDDRQKITSDLNQLIQNFHRVGAKEPLAMFEPGFTVSLRMHQQSLSDVRRRLDQGAASDANARLRGVAISCASCHARLGLPTDFLGTAPSRNGVSSILSAAQYNYAARDFEEARDILAAYLKSRHEPSPQDSDALVLWLAAEMRADKDLAAVEKALNTLTTSKDFQKPAFVDGWQLELRELVTRPAPPVSALEVAQGLLNPALQSLTEEGDKVHLVKTLYATVLLDEIVREMPLSDKRRKALYLRTMATVHTPINIFDVLGEIALEQCVREFPNSAEARRSFLALEDAIEGESRTNGELQLAPEQIARLKELRGLAFGTSRAPLL